MSIPLPTRSQTAASDGADASAGSPDAGPDRRRHPRVRLDAAAGETAATAIRSVEREVNSERRTSGGLRGNVSWTVAPGRGSRQRLQLRLSKSRIIVLGIAAVAGGFAAYLASQAANPSAPQSVAAAPSSAVQVLVASQRIPAGQRLSESSLAWQPWPEQALQPDYITAAATPGAMADMSALMARADLLPGDPIRRQKLTAGAGGFLSASLDKGMRGVSVVVTAESASGGFVTPGDRVDVVLTRVPTGTIGSVSRSETIVHDVRVLAINSKAIEPGTIGPSPDEQPRANTFDGNAIATLALNSAEADLVVGASAIGKLSLLLRPAVDSSASSGAAKAQDNANQAIRLSSPFWWH